MEDTMDLENQVSRLEGRHDGRWRRDDLFAHVSDSELFDMYKRVRKVVSQQEAAELDKLFGEVHEELPD
jgi:hypothetical protein